MIYFFNVFIIIIYCLRCIVYYNILIFMYYVPLLTDFLYPAIHVNPYNIRMARVHIILWYHVLFFCKTSLFRWHRTTQLGSLKFWSNDLIYRFSSGFFSWQPRGLLISVHFHDIIVLLLLSIHILEHPFHSSTKV